jgi:hypothetical protein
MPATRTAPGAAIRGVAHVSADSGPSPAPFIAATAT